MTGRRRPGAERRPRARHRSGSARPARLIVARHVDLPGDVVFGALSDVPAQRRWIVATRTGIVAPGDRPLGTPAAPPDGPRLPHQLRVGSELVARTGFGPVGIDDAMRICEVEPLRRWRVRHVGAVVRGWGEFGVLPRHDGCLVYWAEEFDVPWGGAGRALWCAVRPVIRLGMRVSLARLHRGVRSGSLIGMP